ncbi:type I-E CRISPR-associated protein Cse1/CasA [Ferrovum sp.]|uniref:type I-E CRISPR-associated protein Cse1/CasA n=1 Tax=Ferrovum sp. TaxID=2609467 RepID=UPI0026187BA7|nr:type I-E CRISPR-associated protein Cse1/CasA [Ferrovum sp.]
MDIFRDAWLPTDAGVLTPSQALSKATRFTWPRPDWNAASLLFLHAMVQTAVVINAKCPDRDAWRDLLRSAPADIESWFDGLDAGSKPYQYGHTDRSKCVSVAALMPENPGKNTRKKASDVLVWDHDRKLTLCEAQIAVMSGQLWGLSGGAGHYMGCRGGQPLTVLVEPAQNNSTLWQRVWLNVLPLDSWERIYGKFKDGFVFPWNRAVVRPEGMSLDDNDDDDDNPSTKTANKEINEQDDVTAIIPFDPNNPVTNRISVHPLEMLWQMPRLWNIVQDSDGMVRNIEAESRGHRYFVAAWNHPLTSYRGMKDGKWSPYQAFPRVGFNDWAGIVYGFGKKSRRGIALGEYVEQDHSGRVPIRLRCFGWSVKGKSVASWVENVVPYYPNVENRIDHSSLDQAILEIDKAKEILAVHLGDLWQKRKSKKFLSGQSLLLYVATEAEFYERVAENNWEGWGKTVRKAAVKILWDTAEAHGTYLTRTASVCKTLSKKISNAIIPKPNKPVKAGQPEMAA